MKKVFLTLFIPVFLFALIVACQPSKEKTETESGSTAEISYTCTMHPEVISAEPGKCPKCGMDLVKMEMTDEEMKNMDMDSEE